MSITPIQKIFAYNTGSTVYGTTQVGDIAISEADVEYSANYGGLQWWGGPDETNGYVIAYPIPGCNRQTPVYGLQACLGFKRSTDLTSNSFIELANSFVGGPPAPFSSATDASTYLTNNGYWNSYSSVTPTPTPTIGATPTPTVTNTPTVTQTPTATDLSSITTYTISGCTNLNTFVANLGPGALAPGDVFYFDFTGGTPSGCYRIVNKINATPTDGTTPLYFYSNCALCVAAREVTPTPTVTSTSTPTPTSTIPGATPTPTPTVTNTQTPTNTLTPTPSPTTTTTPTNTTTPSNTPTFTPTPSTSPTPVTGYSFNLVVLPYNYPTSGNTIMVDQATPGIGTTNPNVFATTNNGIYFNTFDSNGTNRNNYFASFTGQSITITLSQSGNTAIYSGDSKAFQSWSSGADSGFTFGYGIAQPGYSAGTTVLIQSASTPFITGQTVTISAVVNGAGVTPTPTATSVTPTPTPTSGSSGTGWFFYSPNNSPVLSPPSSNGNTTFITNSGIGLYNPNYTGGTFNLYFNNNNSAGTSYASQFSTLDTAGGTITVSQGSSTVIYSGTASEYTNTGTFTFLNVTRPEQMIQSAATPFVSGTSISVVVS